MAKKGQDGSVGTYTPPNYEDLSNNEQLTGNEDFMDDVYAAMQSALYGNTYDVGGQLQTGEELYDFSMSDPEGEAASWIRDNWDAIQGGTLGTATATDPTTGGGAVEYPGDPSEPAPPVLDYTPGGDGVVPPPPSGGGDVTESAPPTSTEDQWLEDVQAQLQESLFGNQYDIDGQLRTGEQVYNWASAEPEGRTAEWLEENWDTILSGEYQLPTYDEDTGGGLMPGDTPEEETGGGGLTPGDIADNPEGIPEDLEDDWYSDIYAAMQDEMWGNTYETPEGSFTGEQLYNLAFLEPQGYWADWLRTNWDNLDEFGSPTEPVDNDLPDAPEPDLASILVEGASVYDPTFQNNLWNHLANVTNPLQYDIQLESILNAQREYTNPDAFDSTVVTNTPGDSLGWENSGIKRRGKTVTDDEEASGEAL